MKKSDISTIIGLVLGFLVIIAGMIWGQASIIGAITTFYDLASIFVTVFGSFFAVMISVPMSSIKNLPKAIRNAFFEKLISQSEIINIFVELSKKARKEGLLSLEDEVANLDDPFLKSGIQMVVDGIEPEIIREILELELTEMEKRHQSAISVLRVWAGMAPAYGMIGTLIGLILMLKNLQDQASLGPNMAVALITSFYGAVMSNFLFNPLASKLENKSNDEIGLKEMMLEGILAIQSGVNPRIVEDKLKAFLPPEERLKMLQENVGKGAVVNE